MWLLIWPQSGSLSRPFGGQATAANEVLQSHLAVGSKAGVDDFGIQVGQLGNPTGLTEVHFLGRSNLGQRAKATIIKQPLPVVREPQGP